MCWLIAAHDEEILKGDCGGCFEKFHDYVKGRDGDLFRFYQIKKDPYPILVAFGAICGFLWLVTGVLALLPSKKLYLAVGAANTVIFTVVFTCIYERVKDSQVCTNYFSMVGATTFAGIGCKTDDNWQEKHIEDSYEFFWASSLFAFLMATYQLCCAATLVYEEIPSSEADKDKAGKPEEKKQPEPAPTVVKVTSAKPDEKKDTAKKPEGTTAAAPPTQPKPTAAPPTTQPPLTQFLQGLVAGEEPKKTGEPTIAEKGAAPVRTPMPEEKKVTPTETKMHPEPETKKEVVKESPKTSGPPAIKEVDSVLVAAAPVENAPPVEDDFDDFDLNPPPEDSPIPSMPMKSTFGPPPNI